MYVCVCAHCQLQELLSSYTNIKNNYNNDICIYIYMYI